MFTHLIESGSHRGDLARKGRFFLGTLGLYGLLLTLAGIASVHAYNAHLGTQSYDIVFLPPPVVAEAEQPPDTPDRPRPAAAGTTDRVAVRTVAYTDLNTTPRELPPVSSGRVNVPPVPHNTRFIIGDENFTPVGPAGPRRDGPPGPGDGTSTVRVNVPLTDDPEPAVRPTPAPTPERKKEIRVSPGVLSGKMIYKPTPAYPAIAKAARVSGPVNVEVLIDEQGNVVSARAVGGQTLLRVAAEQAARQARFSPTKLGDQPVKVSGVITFNFVLH